jgi:uncharacterized membrane protein
MSIHKVLNAVNILIAALIIIGLNTFAHICTSMQGPCAKTKTLAIAVAIVLAAAGLVQIFVSDKRINAIIGIAGVVIGLVTILLPLVIAPVCSMPSMHCYVYTRPFLVITGIVIAIVSVIDAISIKAEK